MPCSPQLHHYVISDLHLGHKKATQFKNRTQFQTLEEHDDYILDSINKVCSKSDYLWILGDVAFSRESMEQLRKIKCSVALILGNHDNYSVSKYSEQFTQIRAMAQVSDNGDRYLLTHIPVHPSQKDRWLFNIHGHLHSKLINDPFYINVSCELHEFKPQCISTIVNAHKLLSH